MRDYVVIGSTPTEEDCAQVGSADYATKARKECARFVAQIQRHYPEPDGGYLKIKSNPHDFGTSYEVDDEEASRWAYDIEGDVKNVLMVWDDHFAQA
jgi:hypothetical protein